MAIKQNQLSAKYEQYKMYFDNAPNPEVAENMLAKGIENKAITLTEANQIRMGKDYANEAYKQDCIDKYGFYNDNLFFVDSIKERGEAKLIEQPNNTYEIVKHLCKDLRFEEFTRRYMIGDKEICDSKEYDINLTVNRAYKGGNVRKQNTIDAAHKVANESKYNELTEYFKALPKSTTKHLDNWLTTICGAEDTPLNRAMGRKWLISGVARGMVPGAKVDSSLILTGKQGGGKSELFRVINPKPSYYICAGKMDLTDIQKSCTTFQGRFIIEFGELSSLRGNTDDLKGYLTKPEDTYIPKYLSTSVTLPRQFIFGGTTNKVNILSDTTGNRRYWCVAVQDTINIEKLKEIVKDLWCEAKDAYDDGEIWHLTKEESAMLEKNNELYQEDNPLLEHLAIKSDAYQGDVLPASDLHKFVHDYYGKHTTNSVSEAMFALGWTKKKATSGEHKDRVIYIRPQSADNTAVKSDDNFGYDTKK